MCTHIHTCTHTHVHTHTHTHTHTCTYTTIKLLDVDQGSKNFGKLVEDLPGHADEVFAVDWSADGARVASGSKDCNLKLWRY